VLNPQAELNEDVGARLADVNRFYEFVLHPGELVLIPERWAHAVHNLDDTVAMTYNFVDEANLDCYRQSLRDKAGQLLRKLFDQLAQGRGRTDAVRAFSKHSNLAYYAHLITREAGPSAVRVDAEHSPWERFFGQQGPYAVGGQASLHEESERLVARLLSLIEASPPAAEAAAEEAEALLARFEEVVRVPSWPAASNTDHHDEL